MVDPPLIVNWLPSAVLGLFFAVGAGANAHLLLIAGRRSESGRRVPSIVPLVPGLLGMAACMVSPEAGLRRWAWVPLLLDVGCVPYLLLMAAALLGDHFRKPADPPRPPTPEARAAAARLDAIRGCLLGTAAGDALGLPMEGISRARQARRFREIEPYAFVFGRGMCSDDTEHTAMVAQALIASGGDPRRFGKSLAWRFRFWLLGLPAGIGWATLRALIKLWMGFGPATSGVYSAGNGPAMRSAILGACFGRQPEKLRELVRINTRITHTDPRAEAGALAVAVAAGCAVRHGTQVMARDFAASLRETGGTGEMETVAAGIAEAIEDGVDTAKYAVSLGCEAGVSGFVAHTVPVALHAWLSHPDDLQAALTAVIRCGGDTDTAAAVVGGIVGAGIGAAGIPEPFTGRLAETPRSVAWLGEVARRLERTVESGLPGDPVPLSITRLMIRNVVFLLLVLGHGLRRLLPPY